MEIVVKKQKIYTDFFIPLPVQFLILALIKSICFAKFFCKKKTPAAGSFAPRLPKYPPPHCEFLATRLTGEHKLNY